MYAFRLAKNRNFNTINCYNYDLFFFDATLKEKWMSIKNLEILL